MTAMPLADGTYFTVAGRSSKLLNVYYGGRYYLVEDTTAAIAQTGLPYDASTTAALTADQAAGIPIGPVIDDVYPVTHFDSGNVDLGANHWMQTQAGVSLTDATLSGLTHTFTCTDLGGFHGGVAAILGDADDNVIAPTPQNQPYLHVYGVDGRWIGTSDRHDAWVINYAEKDIARADRVYLFHSWNPSSFQQIMDKWVQAANSITQLATDAGSIVKTFKQIFSTS